MTSQPSPAQPPSTAKKLTIALVTLHADFLWGRTNYYYNPLAASTLAGYAAQQFGSAVDFTFYDSLLMSHGEIARSIQRSQPALVGISTKSESHLELQALLKALLGEPDNKPKIGQLPPPILCGGIAAAMQAEELLEQWPELHLIIGEGELGFAGFIRHLRGELPLEQVPSLIYLRQGKVAKNDARSLPLSGQTFQPHLVNLDQVQASSGEFWLESSRGCDGGCSFCSKNYAHFRASRHRRFPVERTLESMRLAHEQHGVTVFRFSDEDFFAGDFSFIHAFCDGLTSLPFAPTFECDVTVRDIYWRHESAAQQAERSAVWARLSQAGLAHVFVGIESLSDSQLERYNKGICVADIKAAMAQFTLSYAAGFIPLDPLVTLEELRENFLNLKETGIIQHINTPLKFLRAQRKTVITAKIARAGLLGALSENKMAYTYRFADTRVAQVCAIIDVCHEALRNYAHELNHFLRPTSPHRHCLDSELLAKLDQANAELKLTELAYLTELLDIYQDSSTVTRSQRHFLEATLAIYMHLQHLLPLIQLRQQQDVLAKICSDIITALQQCLRQLH